MSRSAREFVESLKCQYDGHLRRFLSASCPAEEVADLAQDCYMKMLLVPNPGLIEHPRAFLLRTARNLLVDRARRGAIEVTSEGLPEAPDHMAAQDPGPHDLLATEQLQRALMLALGELPEMTAHIFKLRRIQGFSSVEIAQQLGVTPRTVQKHLASALVALAERLAVFSPEMPR